MSASFPHGITATHGAMVLRLIGVVLVVVLILFFAGKDLRTAGWLAQGRLAPLISGSPPNVNKLTIWEYLARPLWCQLLYRLYRHPIVMFGVGPAYLFILRCAGARQRVCPFDLSHRSPQPNP